MPLSAWERIGRDDPDYKSCQAVLGAGGAIVGGMTGSFLGPAGTVAGYAGGALWGLAIGYFACPYLAPAIRRKIETGMPLGEHEVRAAAEALGSYASIRQAPDAVKLLGMIRNAKVPQGAAVACKDPAFEARNLLARS